jgi:hypothetical protein
MKFHSGTHSGTAISCQETLFFRILVRRGEVDQFWLKRLVWEPIILTEEV